MFGLFTMIDCSRPDGIAGYETTFWGTPFIQVRVGLKGWRYFAADIVSVAEIEAESYRSGAGMATGAIVGGVLTGGIGLIAGAAIGGRRRRRMTFAAEFTDGHWIVAEATAKDAVRFLAPMAARAKAAAIRQG